MSDSQSIKVFAPDVLKVKDLGAGHFAAVRLDDFSEESLKATTIYSRKDFYKISLISGNATYYYQDSEYILSPGEWVLIFNNREVPYRWDIRAVCSGYSCMFTEDFLPLHTYIRPADWTVFNGESQAFIRMNEPDVAFFKNLFQKMLEEQSSAYTNKYELLFLYVLECIHGALKLQPGKVHPKVNAAGRLTNAFKSLLSGEFPLVYPHQQIRLRTPKHYAERLAVHTNHLNRAVKEVSGKTTTQLINERLMQEGRALLVHSNWSISQIAGSLGFEEPTHFARAFRTFTGQSPSSFR